jgi:LysR family transcriptional regulator, salicylic acid-responsive activator of bsdBCD
MLLKRGSRKAELTEEGTYLYGQAKNILSMMDTTAQELSHFHGGQNGVLRLGTISSSGYILTEQILKNFCREFPRIRFELNEGNTYELLEQLKNGIIECAILRTPFNSEGFECIYGPEEPLVAVGEPRFFHCGEDSSIALADLAGIPLIQYRRFDSMLSVAFQNAGIEPSIFCHNDDARTCLLWASAGLGVALVPETITNLPLYKKVQKQLDRVLLTTRENLLGARVVRAFNRQQDEMKKFDEENSLLVNSQVFVGKISAMIRLTTSPDGWESMYFNGRISRWSNAFVRISFTTR